MKSPRSILLIGSMLIGLCTPHISTAQAPPAAGDSAKAGNPPQRGGFGRVAVPADQPMARPDSNSAIAHEQLLEKAKQGGIDIYFVGDSIARRWGTSDSQYKDYLANWQENFFGWNAADFGWGADTVQNILWRLHNGELDGVNPKVIVILAGTNNVGRQPGNDAKVEDIARGVKAIVDICREKAPAATIVVTAIFPRNDNPSCRADD